MRCTGAIVWMIVGLLGLGIWNCGDDKGTSPPPPTETAIGPAGGTAASQDGKATVVIPSGAASSETGTAVERIG